MGGGEMQRRVVSPVSRVDSGAATDKQLGQFGVALFGAPVERTESMIISAKSIVKKYCKKNFFPHHEIFMKFINVRSVVRNYLEALIGVMRWTTVELRDK